MVQTIAIIGAGASGLFAAITAARMGAKVTVYEKQNKVGKKILASGNGKCNFTNLTLSKDDFRCSHPSFVATALQIFNQKDTLEFFTSLGVAYKNRNDYVYPVTNQSSTIQEILLATCLQYQVQIELEHELIKLEFDQSKNQFKLHIQDVSNLVEGLYFDKVILANGSKASDKLGGNESGYRIAKSMGHKIVPIVPALVQLKSSYRDCKSIAGVRCDGTVKLFVNQQLKSTQTGELQFTDYGISGIPVFQLSRIAAYALKDRCSCSCSLDLLPTHSADEIYRIIQLKYATFRPCSYHELFSGIIHAKLLTSILKRLNIHSNTKVVSLQDEVLQNIISTIKEFTMEIVDTNGFSNAQICAGGVDISQISDTMESKIRKGLYFAGELMDVDGICGGYNLQWAWTSGYLAGLNAAK